METQTIATVVLGISTGGIGWFARQLWEAVQALKTELNTLKVEIGTNYVRYDRLRDMFEPVLKSLDEIKATLKEKADKE